MATRDPVPPAIRDELRRIAGRWAALPLRRAEEHLPRLYAVANDLAARAASRAPGPGPVPVPVSVPELGPAHVIDQLNVLAYDLLAYDDTTEGYLLTELVALRRAL